MLLQSLITWRCFIWWTEMVVNGLKNREKYQSIYNNFEINWKTKIKKEVIKIENEKR